MLKYWIAIGYKATENDLWHAVHKGKTEAASVLMKYGKVDPKGFMLQ